MFIATIAGNLGKDAVFKTTQGGTEFCSFSVAANTGFGDGKVTHWVDVTKWGKGSDKLADMLLKGTKVTVSGEFSTREHDGKTYLQLRADHIEIQGGRSDAAKQSDAPKQSAEPDYAADLDDDLPF